MFSLSYLLKISSNFSGTNLPSVSYTSAGRVGCGWVGGSGVGWKRGRGRQSETHSGAWPHVSACVRQPTATDAGERQKCSGGGRHTPAPAETQSRLCSTESLIQRPAVLLEHTPTRVTAVLAAVHVCLPQPEEGVWQDAWVCGVREAPVDEGDCQGADQAAKAKAAEPCVGHIAF